jgi:tRNA threonylcarbamoyladenosine biosynthesis protein TsaB
VTLVLAIDTSTLVSSVAVLRGGDVLAQRDDGVDLHSERLIELIDGALSDAGLALADVDAIAIGAGPGSFTGLRIGMATAKGLCFSTGKPLWAVSSLAALALDGAAALDLPAIVVAVLDARRHEIYAGFYEVTTRETLRELASERVMTPDLLAEVVAELGFRAPTICGDGAVLHAGAIANAGVVATGARSTPSAASVGKLAQNTDRLDVSSVAAPVYIRQSEAEVKFPDGNPRAGFRMEPSTKS